MTTPDKVQCANVQTPMRAHSHITPAESHISAHITEQGKSLKALAQARLQQCAARSDSRTLPRTLPEKDAHITPEKAPVMCGDESALLVRCRTACRNLSLWPQELAANLTPEDREAQLSGEEGPEVLRAFAESLAGRLRTGTLPPHLHDAYARLRKQLAEHPSQRFACEVLTPDDDPILVAVCVRGAGFATLRIARERYDEGKLLTLVHRWNTKEETS